MTPKIASSMFRSVAALGLAILTTAAHATSASAAPLAHQAIDKPANICAAAIARQEQALGIPSHLLAAVSLAESGRWNPEKSAISAWPWTVMGEGKGQFFSSKAEAIAHVQALRARGVRNIDVGCMQVNLLHHPDAFANLEEAFDPESNVAYAASFLRQLFEDSRSWITAVGNYHSATPEFHVRYRNKIVMLWNETRRRAAAAKRQETMAAYRARRAAHLAARGEPESVPDAAATSTRTAAYASQTSTAGSRTVATPAAQTTPAAQAGAIGVPTRRSAFTMRSTIPAGQVLPRARAVPFEYR